MDQQPAVQPYEFSPFFAGGQSARQPVEETVPRGAVLEPEWVETGQVDGEPVNELPEAPTEAQLRLGQEQFAIYCAPCHGPEGDGDGRVVQNGFPAPPSFHSERLRQAPAGHYFDVITNGYGDMYSYADRVQPEERWAIIAYIRALQLSRQAPADWLSDEERQQLDGAEPDE
jgi:mono/diheme cytochrome c family protein